jgi:hypothetical protein
MSSAAPAASSSASAAQPATPLDEDAALAHALAAEWALEDSMQDVVAPIVQQPASSSASQAAAAIGGADSSAVDQAAYVLRCREDMLMHHLKRLTADGKDQIDPTDEFGRRGLEGRIAAVCI